MIKAWHGDSRQVLDWLQDSSIDSCVTDPPYSLVSIQKRFGKPGSASINNRDEQTGRNGPYHRASKGFMGKQWDTGETAFDPAFWSEVLRVLKPGAHLLAFGGTRSYHQLACAIEDAGFEIRDAIMWHYGSGFPKSHDVSKGIDKAAGAEREKVAPRSVIGHQRNIGNRRPYMDDPNHMTDSDEPVTEAAAQWQGWGTALKPATEIICVARKPLSEGTVAANVLLHGTGAINVDGCRVGTTKDVPASVSRKAAPVNCYGKFREYGETQGVGGHDPNLGRWPANVIHDGSEEVLEAFGGVESPARFYYCAKASKSDRAGSKHPTVKPVALLRYLTRLVTPPGGCVLDPFAGSGTIASAAAAEGFDAVLIEREAEYYADISRRIATLLQFG